MCMQKPTTGPWDATPNRASQALPSKTSPSPSFLLPTLPGPADQAEACIMFLSPPEHSSQQAGSVISQPWTLHHSQGCPSSPQQGCYNWADLV